MNWGSRLWLLHLTQILFLYIFLCSIPIFDSMFVSMSSDFYQFWIHDMLNHLTNTDFFLLCFFFYSYCKQLFLNLFPLLSWKLSLLTFLPPRDKHLKYSLVNYTFHPHPLPPPKLYSLWKPGLRGKAWLWRLELVQNRAKTSVGCSAWGSQELKQPKSPGNADKPRNPRANISF